MRFNNHTLSRIFLALVFAIFGLIAEGEESVEGSRHQDIVEHLPDFRSIGDINERKKRFFDYLRPLTETALNEITRERQRLLKISKKKSLTKEDIRWLKRLSKKYRLKDELEHPEDINWDAWLERVDIIPMELILAQAANESAWGTSRFAREGNNLFGQWCYQQGCGLVPARRSEDATHEVAVFKTPADSIRNYLLNINRHQHYRDLRQIRKSIRKQNKPLIAEALALGLLRYSERGERYVESIQKMISINRPLMLGQSVGPS
ncbi:MAG: hypothetical protein D6698_07015 [Gammaproteobacteria bacterium]|nr:MAG: hypothetical protein D6698_07015 [Gammaproteobacteria bacterium]